MSNERLWWGRIETRFSTFAAWVDKDGRLVRFVLNAADAPLLEPDATHDERSIDDLRAQVEEYCAGRRTEFEIDRAAHGTSFQHAVWEALVDIPYGETRSYADIARAIGRPRAARGVGAANAVNPISLIVPCHRVIGADGSLTGYGGGLAMKRDLLAHEAEHGPRSSPRLL